MIMSYCILLRIDNVSDKAVEKIKTHILFFTNYSSPPSTRISCRLGDNVEKFSTAGQATDGSVTRHVFFVCWINKARKHLLL